MKPLLSFLALITILYSPGAFTSSVSAADPAPNNTVREVIFSVQVSPDSPSRSEFRIRSDRWIEGLAKLKQAERSTEQREPSDVKLSVIEGGLTKEYTVALDGTLSDTQGVTWEAKGKWPKLLKRYAERLRGNHYGKLVTWKEADQLIPKGTKFTVMDLETGSRFRVQRRAGSDHADVQPLTQQDTAIMKEIYNGNWSWERRAILAESEAGWLAASMNGMPHGGDGIPGNDFNGHFCIHFAGSVTHKSNSLDPAHQVMVHKAAGQLESYINSLPPLGLIDLFMLAVNQKDSRILKLLWSKQAEDSILSFWLNPDLKMIRAHEVKEQPQPDGLSTLVEVKASQLRNGYSESITLHFRFSRLSPQSPWKIEGITMLAE